MNGNGQEGQGQVRAVPQCAGCGEQRQEHFSPNQWTKGTKRRCMKCVEEARPKARPVCQDPTELCAADGHPNAQVSHSSHEDDRRKDSLDVWYSCARCKVSQKTPLQLKRKCEHNFKDVKGANFHSFSMHGGADNGSNEQKCSKCGFTSTHSFHSS
mmetsp:Transcript_67322/g.140257  ORF Transcript_67322/g.140257 Transcript_67322/m.140257 type:complete len:156 (+) Transcript_67322:144-611(+)